MTLNKYGVKTEYLDKNRKKIKEGSVLLEATGWDGTNGRMDTLYTLWEMPKVFDGWAYFYYKDIKGKVIKSEFYHAHPSCSIIVRDKKFINKFKKGEQGHKFIRSIPSNDYKEIIKNIS